MLISRLSLLLLVAALVACAPDRAMPETAPHRYSFGSRSSARPRCHALARSAIHHCTYTLRHSNRRSGGSGARIRGDAARHG